MLICGLLAACAAAAATRAAGQPSNRHTNVVLDLWTAGKPAFGIYVPTEGGRGGRGAQTTPPATPAPPPVPGARYPVTAGERLAANPLYDYLFLNLEGSFEIEAVANIVKGIRTPGAAGRKALIVRIPSIETAGVDVTRARVKEILAAGADGVTIPHVRSLDEAKTAIGFFMEAGANVWSPSNPRGEIIAMIMLEDPNAVAAAAQIADLPGYSILACGIGSLRAALGGDRDAAEAGTQKVLAETKRTKLVNMLTANAQDVEQRIKEGFLALLFQGGAADEGIKVGRAAAGR